MKSQSFLFAAIALAILAMAFVGITATADGDPMPALQLLITGATPVLTAVAVLMRQNTIEKTLQISDSTDQKVDKLLNGSMQGKLSGMERDVSILQKTALSNSSRIGNIETSLVEILSEVREIRGESPNTAANRLPHKRWF